MDITPCLEADGVELACLRERAMRASLEAVGRYDPVRVKQRFLGTYNPDNTKKIMALEAKLEEQTQVIAKL